MRNIITLAVIGFAVWYWFGPYQKQQSNSSENYQQQLEQNRNDLGRCMRAKDYIEGATGNTNTVSAEQACTEKLGLYLHKSEWHRYSDKRTGS